MFSVEILELVAQRNPTRRRHPGPGENDSAYLRVEGWLDPRENLDRRRRRERRRREVLLRNPLYDDERSDAQDNEGDSQKIKPSPTRTFGLRYGLRRRLDIRLNEGNLA